MKLKNKNIHSLKEMEELEKIEEVEEIENLESDNNFSKLKILYLIIIIILLIVTFIFSFKTGENLYYLINTNLGEKNADLQTGLANWHFDVKIEY